MSVLGDRAMVASAHPIASMAGAEILNRGGNAIDAAIAMAAMTAVALPAQCGVGGDAFALAYDAGTSSCRAVSGSGFGPDGADLEFFSARGATNVPLFGPCSVAVPGWVSAITALALAATRPLDELFAPAVAAARNGITVSVKNGIDLATHEPALRRDAASAAIFVPGGRLLRSGDRMVQEDLADTLEEIARDPRAFYHGGLGERIVSALREAGAPFSGEEWAAQEALVSDGLGASYAGHRIVTTSPPSPGYMVLQQAGILDGLLGDLEPLGAPAIEAMVRAAARSFADRFAAVGSDNDAYMRFLAPAALRAARLELAQRGRIPTTAIADGDTTSFVVVDAERNAVSFIHSLAFTWGARLTAPGTGVLLNDRLGRGTYLFPGHPNALAPRRRPMHTLNAWIALDATGALRAAGNTPGGDGQVQWNVQLLSHLLDHGLSAQDVVDAPRFSIVPGSDANVIGAPLEVAVESRVPKAVRAELAAAGLPVMTVGPYAGGGGAQLVEVVPELGSLSAGSDSRQDGCALSA